MTDSPSPAEDLPEEDEHLLRRLVELDVSGCEVTDESNSSESSELLVRIQRTRSLLELVGRVGSAARTDPTFEQETRSGERHPSQEISSDPPARIGRFEIQGELGRGGCGIVFRAFDPKLKRTVALKVPRPGALLSADMRQRFLREAFAAAALDHPNITAVFEAGEDNYLCYIASAICVGPTMDQWIHRRAELPSFQLAAEIAKTLAHAVHHAHSRGVLHRDLKPGNVILVESHAATFSNGAVYDSQSDTEFIPRLTDFGLARLDGGADNSTASGVIVGTFNYMAPEQAEGRRDITTGVDIYGLGAILFELLTGKPPLDVASHASLLNAMNNGSVPDVRALRADVPADLETICLKCLNHVVTERYPSAIDVADELQRFLIREPIRARRASQLERICRWSRRRPAVAVLTATTIFSCLAVVVGSVMMADMLLREKTVTAEHLEKTEFANRELLKAYRLAETRTVEALLAQAGRVRVSGRAGRRFEGIKAIEKASGIAANLRLGAGLALDLRNELLACVSLPDLREDVRWHGYRKGSDHSGIAISPDGELYARFLPDGSLSLRRFRDDVEVRNIVDIGYSGPHRLPLRFQLRFSPDSSMIASAGEHANINHLDVPTRVWQVATGEPLLSVLPEGFWEANDFDFSPDSRQIAIGFGDGAIRFYSLPSGEEKSATNPPVDRTMATIIRYSPRNDFLAVVRESELEVWNVSSLQQIKLHECESSIRDIAWLPDGEEIACIIDGQNGLRICHVSTNKPDLRTVLASEPMIHAAFHPDGRTVATVESRTTSLFDLPSELKLLEIDGLAIDFDRSGQYLAFGLIGSRIGRWEYSAAPECQMFICRDVLPDRACLSFSRDNLLAVSCDGGVRLFDPDQRTEIATIPASPALLGQFLITGDDLLSVSPAAAELRSVDWTRSGDPPEIGEPRILLAADSSPLGYGLLDATETEMLIRREDGITDLVALADSSVTKELALEPFWTMAVTPDRDWAVTTYWHDSAVVWNANTFQPLHDLDCIRARAEFSRDGHWLVVGNSQEYHVHSVGDWSVACHFDRDLPGQGLSATAFTIDSQLLAIADSLNTVRVFNTSDWSEAATLTMPVSSPANWLAFSPDQSRLAACTSDGVVCVWNLHLLARHLAKHDLHWSLTSPSNGN